LDDEIEELERYMLWARSVGVDTKSKALLTALETGFSNMVEMGASRKALVFTESRRTQQYLKSFLEANGFAGQVVLFSGSNTDPESQAIYERWKTENVATGRATGSKIIDLRTALIEHFRDRATIMIGTEAGAEGINLQFCSLVINYDLPWNPQRIEQRIGREDYGWTTVSKIRGIMNRIFKIGIIHKKVSKNPVEGLATSTKTAYKAIKITPAQTLLILRSVIGNMLHFTLVFVVAATALRSSEVLSLRWADILWEERKIRIAKSWKKTGVDGSTKTRSSERDVPMGRVLTHYLREWRKQTPYPKPTDFVFPSIKEGGRVPICASVFCRVHLRPAAKKAGVVIPDGHRWGLHNLRHSLSNWLVNKAKENPKTVQGILGHSRIQTTLDLYTDEDLDEMIAAQEKFLDAVGFESGSVQ
jgi:integrase